MNMKLAIVVLLIGMLTLAVDTAMAENAVEFPGTVLAADSAAGKLTVKKQDGGTRFTFVVNDKTQFGPPWKSLDDVKKGDAVTVTYATSGSQYIAQKVTKGK